MSTASHVEQAELKSRIVEQYIDVFGTVPERIFQAPGRVNLIGEHTDYNDGFVLPCAINFQTMVAATPRLDRKVQIIACDYDNQKDIVDLDYPIEFNKTYPWANYIRGVINCLLNKGYEIGGLDLMVAGNIPQGAGLSSSASLEVVIGQAFSAFNQLNLSQQEIALIAQQAENEFVGCHCGVMDQLASAKGKKGSALLLDCRSLETRAVVIPEDLTILIANSNVQRTLVGSEYNDRRKQCELAAEFFEIKALRDIDLKTFESRIAELSAGQLDPVVEKRARHVISENERTVQAGYALEKGDIYLLGRLMTESHQSMKNEFEITVPAIDSLVSIIKSVIGDQGGVRMTGGGFGGCVVTLLPKSLIESVCKAIKAEYQPKTGLVADVFVCDAMDGGCEISH